MLELSCLGYVELKRDGQPVEGCVSAKAQALLIYLAVTGQSHSRESLDQFAATLGHVLNDVANQTGEAHGSQT